jgi:hypothetical protein
MYDRSAGVLDGRDVMEKQDKTETDGEMEPLFTAAEIDKYAVLTKQG